MNDKNFFAHATAEVSPEAKVGSNTKIWNHAQVRNKSEIGDDCIIGKNSYIDTEVIVGNKVKIQNNCSLYKGTIVEDGVFIGPHVVFTNDKNPRAINFDGTLKEASDWDVGKTVVKYGASLGACSVILPNVTIGRFALVGSGAVVTKDVAEYAVVMGNPARPSGFVCKCAKILRENESCNVCKVTLKGSLVKED